MIGIRASIIFSACLIVILAAGCGVEPTPVSETPVSKLFDPSISHSAGPTGFFPLEIGSSWRFRATFEIEIIVVNSPAFAPSDVFEGTIERRTIGTEEIFGREYVIEETRFNVTGLPDTTVWWTRFREDHAGLYNANVSKSLPPGMAPHGAVANRGTSVRGWGRLRAAADRTIPPGLRIAWREHVSRLESILDPGPALPIEAAGRPGGAEPGEIVRLVYPLHPGSTWFNRVAPIRVWSSVEGLEVIRLPAGRFPVYRIQVKSARLDEDDRVTAWFGRCGRLGYTVHLETVAIDIGTGETVRIITDQSEWLADLDLTVPGRCRNGTKE